MKACIRYLIFCPALIMAACRDRYNPPLSYPVTGYLVVDGFINSGNGPTTIRLSRSAKPGDSIPVRAEPGATLAVEGDHNTRFDLQETAKGVYTNSQLHLNPSEKFRLHIWTAKGKQYVSGYETIVHTPPVDTINWTRNGKELKIYVDTHDPQGNTRYYTWEYDETWEIQSKFPSMLEYVRDANGNAISVKSRPISFDYAKLFTCWRNAKSTNILAATSIKLSQDNIHFPLLSVTEGDDRFSILYSINVKQHGVSPHCYDFLVNMKKNTEGLGSIFDAQPSELRGNIRCIDDVTEQVIGYITVADAQEKRFFIKTTDVLPWPPSMYCVETVVANVRDSVMTYSYLMPTTMGEIGPGGISTFKASEPLCVDCTLRGSSVKPSFWP